MIANKLFQTVNYVVTVTPVRRKGASGHKLQLIVMLVVGAEPR